MTGATNWIRLCVVLILSGLAAPRDGLGQETEIREAEISSAESYAAGTVAIGPSLIVTSEGRLDVRAGSIAIRPHFAIAAGGELQIVVRALARPDLFAPVNGARDVPTLTTFSWGSVDGATAYNLQVATDDNFSTVILDEDPVAETTFEVGLGAMTSYYWRVRALDLPTVGTWSAVYSFSTATNVGVGEEGDGINDTVFDYDLRVYPNPIGPSATVNVELPRAETVEVAIYDIIGRRVAVLHSGQLARGVTDLVWTRAAFARGIYYARLETSASTIVRTIVLD